MIKIEILNNKLEYLPGETVQGRVSWQAVKPVKSAEIRLFWYTSGKGTQDVGIADTVHVENPQQNHDQEFTLNIPEAPYSFSGKLISLIWAIECVLEPSDETERVELTISTTGKEVLLQ
jgi:hypothetical protein